MEVIGIVLVLVAVTGIAIGAGGRGTGPLRSVKAARMMTGSRERLELMLRRLDREDPPPFVMGAMCYAPVALPDRAEYICPVCGERTLYTGHDAMEIEWGLPAMRRLVESMADNGYVRIFLEETYCIHCHPQGPGFGEGTILVVVHEQGDTVRTAVNITDLQAMEGFLRGELHYLSDNDSEIPLRGRLERLRVMLGLDDETGSTH